jgi:hypothetical protein
MQIGQLYNVVFLKECIVKNRKNIKGSKNDCPIYNINNTNFIGDIIYLPLISNILFYL